MVKKLQLRIKYFFPIQLLISYFKRDYMFLFSWLILFLIITKAIGEKFGLQFIFLSPEYMGHINNLAFLFTGFGVGSFIVAFNISAYVVAAHRYPFIATVSRPFLIFSLNNFIIPFLYIVLYIYESFKNQIYYELLSFSQSLLNILFFLLGIIVFILFSFAFFYFVVKILPKIIKIDTEKLRKSKYFFWLARWSDQDKEKKLYQSPKENTGSQRIEFYIGSNLKIKPSRDFSHYNTDYLTKIFRSQHIQALMFVIFLLMLIILRGLFSNSEILILPAGASIHILFTIILLFVSLFYILFAEWSLLAFFIIILVSNFVNPVFTEKYTHSAYGMNYTIKNAKINPLAHGDYSSDSLQIIQILDKWQKKEMKKDCAKKPKIVVISASGGGMKMAIWAYRTISVADSMTNGKLLKNTRLMTGASGGMFGMAYLREMYREQLVGEIKNYRNRKYIKKLSKDLLNPVFFTLTMSDWYPHIKKIKFRKYKYRFDRAYMFELTVNKHLRYALQRPLIFYKKYELSAKIPMLIITPSIMNVGTRMIISPLNLSFLTKSTVKKNVKNIEFRYVYKKFNADSLNFLSAIRMNASFPYVTPFITLPARPRIRVFDAGLNDNYGFLTAYDFLVEFSDWINKNTSGVIYVNLCENELVSYDDKNSALNKLLEPIASLYSKWDIIQNSNNFSTISSLKRLFPGKFHIINLTFGNKKHKISLSWHLTEREKKYIFNAIKNSDNQEELRKLSNLLK